MIKNIFRYILVIATVAAFASCSVDEIDNVGSKGAVKFVVQPTNYIGCDVSTGSTKASAEDFENKIVNAHFLLFNADENLMHYESFENVTNNTIPTQVVDMDLQTGKVTACFIANVPTSTVSGFTTLSQVKEAVLDIHYYSGKVLDSDNNKNFFVIPEFDLKDDGEMVQCIPMLGIRECTLGSNTSFDISLKRLFAKVSMNIGVIDGSLTNTKRFDLMAAHLINLPSRVKLTEPTNPTTYESAWVKEASAFYPQQIEGPISEDDIYSSTSLISDKSFDFYFYAPEYYLSPTNDGSGNYGNQKYKPNMYDKKKYPILVRLFGEYKVGTGTAQGVTYDLYLGEDASTSFTLKRNMHYKNNIKITGITNSINGTAGVTLDCRVDVSELDEVEMLGQTANCYIIGNVGSYLYPAYKGVWKRNWGEVPESYKCTKGTTLKVIYQDNSSIKLANMAFNKETCEISFDVTSVDGGTGLLASNDGNIVIGLYDDKGVIEWSWHLWVLSGTTFSEYLGGYEIQTQYHPSGGYLMNRNLGAKVTTLQQETPGIVTGLYYKYGHKEPFIGNDYRGGGESESYSWIPTDSKHNKSQTDPCPPGYRMPMASAWNGSHTKEHASITGLGDAFRFYNNNTTGILQFTDDIYYPYSGYVASDGISIKTDNEVTDSFTTLSADSFSIEIRTDEKVTQTIETNLGLMYYQTQDIEYTEHEYYDFNYKTKLIKEKQGFLWGKDSYLNYSYDGVYFTDGVEIINCKYRTRKTTRQQQRVRSRWGSYGDWYELTAPTTGPWSAITEITRDNNNILISKNTYGNINNSTWVASLKSDQSDKNISLCYTDTSEKNSSKGFQVRCLKD